MLTIVYTISIDRWRFWWCRSFAHHIDLDVVGRNRKAGSNWEHRSSTKRDLADSSIPLDIVLDRYTSLRGLCLCQLLRLGANAFIQRP